MIRPENVGHDTAALAAERPAASHRFVVVCLLVAGGALVPGLMGRAGVTIDAETTAGRAFHHLLAALADIRFGSGLRFWLGVTGASAMALLLIYPLRKLFAGRRFLGSVGAWFKLHLIIGVFAPVAILYHANFDLGGTNANVALWTMLAVTASGIVGHFVYARVSAAFYADKLAARRNLDAALALLSSLGGAFILRSKLAERLEHFDAERLTPRTGVRSSLRARYNVAKEKRALIKNAVMVTDQAASEMRLDPRLHQETRVQVATLLHAYFAFAGRAANRSVKEQVWARWRMFHLPLFLVMCAATTLHVAAVWDMDAPEPSVTSPVTAPVMRKPSIAPTMTKDQVASSRTNPIQQVKRTTITVDATATTEPPPAPQIAPARRPPPPRPLEGSTIAAAPVPVPTEARSAPRTRAAEAPKAITAVPPTRPEAETKQLYEEVQRRVETETQPRMALGKSRSLDEQIATLKAKMRTREFKHSDAETGFALSGKHTRAECIDCHKQPLQEARSDTPRQCIACHKKDDVHKGRRPDCADCHTANSWRERKRKR